MSLHFEYITGHYAISFLDNHIDRVYVENIYSMQAELNPTLRFLKRRKEGHANFTCVESIDGVRLMNDLPAARIIEHRDKMMIRPDDVFVCTYPKCGTTWMQQIVKLIANNGVENGINHDVFVPWIDHMTLEEAEAMSSPRHFKTHLPYKLMPGGGDPANAKGNYIYVMRNPKDAVVSDYHFSMKVRPHHLVPPWETFFDKYCQGEADYGCIFSHFIGWWNHKVAGNIFIVTYEEMKKDLKIVVSRLATFLGYQLSANTIHSIAEQTMFDNMKSANKIVFDDFSFDAKIDFMRKGIVGDWRNMFTAEQSAKIDLIAAEKFAGTGLHGLWGCEQEE